MKQNLFLVLIFLMISNISLANDRCESIYKKKTAFVSVENSSPDKIDFISNAFQQILNLFGKNNGLSIPDIVNVKSINSFLGDRYEGGSNTLFTSLSMVPPQISEKTILFHELTHIVFDQNVLVKIGDTYLNPKLEIGKIQNEQEELTKKLSPLFESIEDAKYSDNQELVDSLKLQIEYLRSSIKQLDLKINPLKSSAKLFGIYSEMFSDVVATLIVKDALAVSKSALAVPVVLPSGHKYFERAFDSDLTIEEWQILLRDSDLSKASHSGLDFVRVHIGRKYIFSENPLEARVLLNAIMLATKQQYNSISGSEKAFDINIDFCRRLDEIIKKNSVQDEFNYKPRKADIQKAETIAREAAEWFNYTIGPMGTEHLGQCSDYAVWFILKYNEYAGNNVARLVVANNPIQSGTYRLGDRVDLAKLGFYGFSSGSSGFLSWKEQLYIYHPILGAYPIFLEKSWIPKLHFGVNMTDKDQVHAWASIGEISVDPTYFDLRPDKFKSPLGADD